jgi:hypothetical protein
MRSTIVLAEVSTISRSTLKANRFLCVCDPSAATKTKKLSEAHNENEGKPETSLPQGQLLI